MKQTIWTELKMEDCIILEKYIPEGTIDPVSIQLNHPALKKPRWFTKSKKNNWNSRYTHTQNDVYAEGYIIRL